jgi:DNA-binding CsgD family transcriptional regulator
MGLIDLSTVPDNQTRFTDFLDQLCDWLEMDYAAYAGINPVDGTVHAHVNYPEDWKAHYTREGFHKIDPTLHVTRRSIAPVDWRRLDRDAHYRRVFDDARAYGIGEHGVTIPVRGPFGDIGMLSVTRRCRAAEWDRLANHVIGDLQTVAVHIHDTVMRSDILSRVLRHPALSKREKEILQWIAAGKSQQDIGDILLISHRTVEVHLRSAREKLYALTTAQAVGRGLSLGLIYPS